MVEREEGWAIGAIIALVLIVVLLFNTIYTIPAGYRGVILTFGKPTMVAVTEGLHVKVPFAQNIVKMSVRTQKYEAELTAASKDLQDVNTKIAINYHIIPEKVPEIYRDIGLTYAETVVYPYEQETNKGITSQFTAEELITKREQVRERMKVDLAEKLRPRGVIVEEVSIINFAFSQSFTQAIELKVTAEQNALTSKNKLEQVKYEAQQAVETAKGQKLSAIAQAEGNRQAVILNAEAKAESIRLIQEQLQRSPDYMKYYKIDKWDGILPKYVGTEATPFIDISTE